MTCSSCDKVICSHIENTRFFCFFDMRLCYIWKSLLILESLAKNSANIQIFPAHYFFTSKSMSGIRTIHSSKIMETYKNLWKSILCKKNYPDVYKLIVVSDHLIFVFFCTVKKISISFSFFLKSIFFSSLLYCVCHIQAPVSNKDKFQRCALHHCVENPATECAEYLLRAIPSLLSCADEEGLTPLHMAVIAGNGPLVKLLLKRGANLNVVDNEKHTVVHWATGTSNLYLFPLSKQIMVTFINYSNCPQ